MLNNFGLPGLLVIVVALVAIIVLAFRPSKRVREQKRIADALEKIADKDET